MPIMGGPKKVSSDTLPRPFCPGLFEWTTDSDIPSLCPCVTVNETPYYPAWWPASTQLLNNRQQSIYKVKYSNLMARDIGSKLSTISWEVEYRFETGFFTRLDTMKVHEDILINNIHMEVLQGAKHPKAIQYPKVYELDVNISSNIPGARFSKFEDVSQDPDYLNYYSHPSSRSVFNVDEINLKVGDYTIQTNICY